MKGESDKAISGETIVVLLILLSIALAGSLCCLIMTISNLRAVSKLAESGGLSEFPPVSVIVPARNEERNICACVSSLLRQDYPDFEVIAVNDHSEDGTGEIPPDYF